MTTLEVKPMEVLENIVLGDFAEHLTSLRTPLDRHVRIVIEDIEAPVEDSPTKKKLKFSELSICGMWADREDMDDPAAYVRKLREPRYKDAY